MLTVYGIETLCASEAYSNSSCVLQQCLPFTVLKHIINVSIPVSYQSVATVLTVYGIETGAFLEEYKYGITIELQQCLPFTVLKHTRQ